MTRTICLHGPESTGKSMLAPRLARSLGGAVVDEYGRTFAEANGLDFTMADLVGIAVTHDNIRRAMAAGGIDPRGVRFLRDAGRAGGRRQGR
ncbi:MAG: ATP-binding protein, partial [Pseudomonadota bacterium]|nr:ATP-binding protein [Pseudomonadota bacterium]